MIYQRTEVLNIEKNMVKSICHRKKYHIAIPESETNRDIFFYDTSSCK